MTELELKLLGRHTSHRVAQKLRHGAANELGARLTVLGPAEFVTHAVPGAPNGLRGHESPEQLTPDEDQERLSASAIYTRLVGKSGYFAATAAWGRKTGIEANGRRGAPLDAYLLEGTVKPNDRWTVFARAEQIDTDELLASPGTLHGPTFTVGKGSLGAIRDFTVARGLRFGIGGLVARSLTPAALDPSYGGDRTSGMAFVRLKLG